MQWHGLQSIHPSSYTCGHCGNKVGSNQGWHTASYSPTVVAIYVCSVCLKPSLFLHGSQYPGVSPGQTVSSLPEDVDKLYNEARASAAANAHTSAVLASRKLLMHIAVAQGADENQSFLAYVDYLAGAGYVPPNGRGWVDHIRKRGNEANHEIQLMTREDSEELLTFLEMLLKFVYEFPARVPARPADPT
ncbi:MAG: hypothetical protein DDT26_02088 [Dehalococcoidia bacterium]|nr:hypothetical protein [Chloroflexota bacterium]